MGGNAIDGWRDEHRQSLRAFLHRLEGRGELRHVRAAVDPKFELSAYLSLLDGGPALMFHAPLGHAMAVVGNVLATRERCARALGVEPCRLYERLRVAASERVAPALVRSAPCQATIVEMPDLGSLPVPTFFEHETGPYITAGVVVAGDPETGRRNVSIARVKLLGDNRAMIGIAPNHHLALFARRAAERGRDLEIAVAIGNHPAVMLAACLYLDAGEDEFEAAGVLLGEPLDLVRCAAVDLEVPAHCELVLQGVLRPTETVDEGPVSEFHGMYERYGRGYVVEFGRLTRRTDAFLHVVEPGLHREHVLLGGVAIAGTLGRAIGRVLPNLRRVAVTDGGCGRLHAVVALADPAPGDARRAMLAAWAAVSLIKTVTVVDDDVDPDDPADVERAVATRLRADRDLLVVPEVRADRAEPLERDRLATKLGLDATKRPGDRPDWTPARPPAAVLERVARSLFDAPAPPGNAPSPFGRGLG